jgi:glyceraldehyde 3-phosphate dehydrogenase
MTIKVAINGYGRIGRNVLRAHYEGGRRHGIEVVAINDIGRAEGHAHLTKYDSVHGPFPGTVALENDHLVVNGDRVRVLSKARPSDLPWAELDVDVVLECTGFFTTREKASGHLAGGARKVLISAPGQDMDATVVYGVNDHTLQAGHVLVSNGSCTTNCLAPLLKPLHETLGVVSGLVTTIHSYANDQVLTDVYRDDLRRARSATMSLIPTRTGAAVAVGRVLPELDGRLDGFAIRVPTINVSLVDLSFTPRRATSVDEVNAVLKAAADGELAGILGYNTEPLVSVDFNHNPLSAIVDEAQTRVSANGTLVKVLARYDNEWAFSNRMLDTAAALVKAGR